MQEDKSVKFQRRMLAPAALVTLGLLVTGCAGQPGEPDDNGSGESSTGYVIAVAQDFQGADRASYSSEAAKTLADVMQGRLLDLKKESGDALACYDDAPAELEASSALVDSWDLTEDGLGLNITLKHGVTSAAGNELTAADVEWTIERIQAIDTTGDTLWFGVGGFDADNPITIHDDYSLTLNLPAPNALAPYALAGTAGMIYDSETVIANATEDDPWGVSWLQDNTANYGPWNLTQFSSQQLVFSTNENYKGERGSVETLTVQSVPDSSSRIQLLQTGDVDEVNGLDFTQMAALSSNEAVTIVKCAATARDWFGVNVTDPILGDPTVRQALSLALDREAIAANVYNDLVDPAVSGLSSAFGVDEGEFYDYDVERAKELLAEAGYPDGFGIELSVSPAQPGAYSADLSALIQQQLGEIGVTVDIKTVPSAVDYRDAGRAQSMQAWLLAESPAFQNAGYSAWLTAGQTGLQNYSGFVSDRLDELADGVMTGSASGDAQLGELSEIMDQEQPAIYLIDRPTIFVRAGCVSEVPTSTLAVDYAGAVTSCGANG